LAPERILEAFDQLINSASNAFTSASHFDAAQRNPGAAKAGTRSRGSPTLLPARENKSVEELEKWYVATLRCPFFYFFLHQIPSAAIEIAEAAPTAPTEVAADSAQSVPPAPLPVVPLATGPPRNGIRRRVNDGVVIAVLLYVFLELSATTFYIRDHGNVPLRLLKLSLAGSGVVYSVAAVVVSRSGRRHSVLIWLAPIAVYLIGYGLMVGVCLECTWASR
jgi:hypothetical protein